MESTLVSATPLTLAQWLRASWPEAEALLKKIGEGRPAAVTGVLRGARAPLIEMVLGGQNPSLSLRPLAGDGISRVVVILTRDEEAALDLVWAQDPRQAPWSFLPLESPPDRLRAWTDIFEGRSRVLIASTESLSRGAPAPQDLVDLSFHLAPGRKMEREVLCDGLLRAGYSRVPRVGGWGEFSLHGGILDVYPQGEEFPARIEFLDDEICSLRTFDPSDQKSRSRREDLDLRPQGLKEGEDPAGIFGPQAWVVWIDPPAAGPEHSSAWLRRAWSESRGGRGLFLFPYGPPPVAGLDEVHLPLRASGLRRGQAEDAAAKVESFGSSGGTLWLCAPDAEEEKSGTQWLARGPFPAQNCRTAQSRITEGFRLGEHWVLPVQEIFSRFPVRGEGGAPRASVRGAALEDLSGLAPGDLVVHRDHGIGRYEGMSHLFLDNREGDFVKIAYAEGHSLYVPAHGLGVLSPYDGGGRPRLFRLGGDGWLRVKTRAKSALRDLAVEMLKSQAARAGSKRPPCGPDGPWMEDLRAAFPHTETPDQTRTWEEIQADMEGPTPMDRLVVGDVGFGKTELALRACFKATAEGRQAAVLVPTTVLAEQHQETFRGRLQGLAVRVECLTRFQTRADQIRVLRDLAAGKVDILIGTHRLLSGDLAFKNLGLLVVDEEHRFGVKDKERLKQISVGVDVLSLSATPIPRSLHLALSGIRGMSRLETPPRGRLPIRTVVCEESPALVQQAITRELSRGGQVFYIVGRIKRMEAKLEQLQKMIPEAKIGLVHGRLPAQALEKAMLRFHRGEDDVLLATTLVESGLDIPRVNTLIVSRSDELGLAQLYQLRGRVGRSDVQARAYFLFDHPDALTADAKKRLDVMEESSALGSGFKLAIRDLEIRGAGNVLGKEQHGHLAALGYAAYCEILAEVAAEAEGRVPVRSFVTEVDLPLDAFLPAEYLGEAGLRLDVYQRLSRAESAAEVAGLQVELEDRFGPVPHEAKTLLDIAKIRALAGARGILRVRATTREMVLEYSPAGASKPKAESLIRAGKGRLRISPDRPFQVRIARVEGMALTQDLEECLGGLPL